MKTSEQIEKIMGSLDSLKIYGANAFAFLSTYTTIDDILKTGLLVATFAYTIVKTWYLIKKNHEQDMKDDEDR